eukprot:220593_1
MLETENERLKSFKNKCPNLPDNPFLLSMCNDDEKCNDTYAIFEKAAISDAKINIIFDDKLYIQNNTLTYIKQHTEQNNENILSLSDDDTTDDKLTLLSDTQRQQMTTNGYCILDDPLNNEKAVCIVQGYIRNNFNQIYMIKDLIRIIINFYNSRYNPELYVEIICINLDDENINYSTFLAPKINISLSRVLHNRMESIAIGNRIEIDSKKVNDESMHRILQYLGHHKGIKPQSISKPIRSVKMERIVSDIWDAHYINSFSKKVIFQVILAANYLDCPCLLHLGAAKIATLIKGKSPEEIRNILADDGS